MFRNPLSSTPLTVLSMVFSSVGCHGEPSMRVTSNPPSAPDPHTGALSQPEATWQHLTDDDLLARKQQLNVDQRSVTQLQGTEPAFHNAFWNNHEPGIYVDVVSGEPLFSSNDKFDSGTGWPSFTHPLDPARVVSKTDASHGMERIEVRSTRADSHLGHLFNDGPAPAGLRYCINSASLRFVPAAGLAAAGYGEYAALFPGVTQVGAPPDQAVAFPPEAERAANQNRTGVAANLQVAVLAGGCFWGMQEVIRKIDGVVSTDVGYSGGGGDTASYGDVSKGTSGHAESIRVVFDPSKLPYDTLLTWFFRSHDPTTPNQQGHDQGPQYRSAIFYQSRDQALVARSVKDRLDKSGVFHRPVVTEIVAAAPFYHAENYHQDYLQNHPGGYTCHFVRDYVF